MPPRPTSADFPAAPAVDPVDAVDAVDAGYAVSAAGAADAPALSPERLADPRDVERLLTATHDDPFAVLGMHDCGIAGLRVVRCLLPGADAVAIRSCDGSHRGALRQLAPGFFAGLVAAPEGNFAYRLDASGPDGSRVLDDPYRYGPLLGELDTHLLQQGAHWTLWRCLGAQPRTIDGVAGVGFAVWAPAAARVSVVGDFNDWDGRRHPMRRRAEAGAWELFVPSVRHGERYQFEIRTATGDVLLKSDPCAQWCEPPPATAARVVDRPRFAWTDAAWLRSRASAQSRGAPMSIYEVHLGSWRRGAGGSHPTYRELADTLVPYVASLGFTHIELMPLAEHPFGGSWGYQPTALFAPTARYGDPDDLRLFVDRCHRAGIGVILDWVPAHFPSDAHGLAGFDGTCLYEHDDPRRGRHREWGTLVYDFGRPQVANFLVANALYWLAEFHVDGLRVDAVASMLYLDYGRDPGEWQPNVQGGNQNLEAVAFLRLLNERIRHEAPGAITIAEESTSWPMVSRPTWLGGLGFDFKWNMGWMNDTLSYVRHDPIHRGYHHDRLTFGLTYAFSENFVLPLSHDEVVHGKGSLLAKMPGDAWQRFANLRLYLAFQFTQPGKKLLFMGGEFGQRREWDHDASLDWSLLDDPADGPRHRGLQRLVGDLNGLYRDLPCLHEGDCEPWGYEWVDCSDATQSVVAWLRQSRDGSDRVLVVCNFTPVVRDGYRVGLPAGGTWVEVLNSDAVDYGGSGVGNWGSVDSRPIGWHGRPHSVSLRLPPLAALVLRG
jgi:1,4-alpha-glucan branching enzyme